MADPKKNWLAQALDSVAQTETNPIALAWRMLPPEARKAYSSVPNALAELSPGASVRDAVQASGQTTNALSEGRGWDAASGVANMLTAAAGVLPGGRLLTKGAKELAQPIRAYHGSPHSFDRFDINKIGTGEGAQAYGRGLYFAENEGVAKGYRDALGGDAMILGGQKIVPQSGSVGDMALAHLRSVPPGSEPFSEARRSIRMLRDAPESNSYLRQSADAALKQLDEWQLAGGKPGAGGSMYEVAIHADPKRFLDWERPIAEQSQSVKRAANNILDPGWDKGGWNPTGGMLVGPHSGEEALRRAQILKDAGIPGVRYLDQGSRSAGAGSSNYVVFDDKVVEILRKYGLLPAGAGAVAAGAAVSQPPAGEAY